MVIAKIEAANWFGLGEVSRLLHPTEPNITHQSTAQLRALESSEQLRIELTAHLQHLSLTGNRLPGLRPRRWRLPSELSI
jgi:hypothetical protein